MRDLVVVLSTVPTGATGDEIGRTLVEEHLAACVNVLPPMTSIYRWRGDVEHDSEQQLVIKTSRSRIPALQARLAALHPYELPEFLVLEVADGSAAYSEWVADATAEEK